MSDIQIFIPDKDNEGEWRDIDEGLLDLSSHDAKVRADGYNKAIDDFVKALIPRLTDAIYPKDVEGMRNLINDVAKQLKEGGKNET